MAAINAATAGRTTPALPAFNCSAPPSNVEALLTVTSDPDSVSVLVVVPLTEEVVIVLSFGATVVVVVAELVVEQGTVTVTVEPLVTVVIVV